MTLTDLFLPVTTLPRLVDGFIINRSTNDWPMNSGRYRIAPNDEASTAGLPEPGQSPHTLG